MAQGERRGLTIMTRTSVAGLQRKIGMAVAKARREQGLTQQGLARVLRTRQANISRIERGLQNLSLDLLARLNDVLRLGLKII
jgi:transcriptional regulator with XRE-family HTH domain